MNPETQRELDFDLVPTHLAVSAMRDNGYRNTAHAIAELIDNAIQAGARHVELLCAEEQELVRHNSVSRVKRIAVLDDGCGMDENTLRMALQFGNGTRLGDRKGIGRFGMGLPSASISQCRKVEVWSWTTHPDEALFTQVNLDQIANGGQREVPTPERTRVPQEFRAAAENLGSSGTLVVWSNLDRCMWKTAKTIMSRSEFVIGRMYRRFLYNGDVTIRMAAFNLNDPGHPTRNMYAEVNDPLYLMTPSSAPAPYDQEAMFQQDGERWEECHEIEGPNGTSETVTVRFTVAKDAVRSERNAGNTKHGKHARDNIGVSIVRAGRELDLDQSLVIAYDPRERWWGVEVDFPPSLDELFGVTNNKQSARHFSDVTANLENLLSDESKSVQEIKDELGSDGDPLEPLIDLVHAIDRRLRNIRKAIKIQAKGQNSSTQRYQGSAEEQATVVTRKMQGEGRHGQSDHDETLPADERQQALKRELIETGLTEDQADQISASALNEPGVKYVFAHGELDGRSFFTVKPVAGEIVIKMNVNHPAYEQLLEVLHDDVDGGSSQQELVQRLQRAHTGLKLLLMAWARFEDEETSVERRELIQDMRTDWGRVAARFLRGQ